MNQKRFIAIVVIAIAIAVAAVILLGIPWGRRAAAPGTPEESGASDAALTAPGAAARLAAASDLPKGPVTYEIAQAATKLPGFVQATIDPLNVKVGQVQHFTVIMSDPNPVTSVVATIVTDHKTVTVNLTEQGAAPVSMIAPRSFMVGAHGTISDAVPGTVPEGIAIAGTAESGSVAEAAGINTSEFTGEWTVEDTHTADYKTTFTATDSKGNVNEVTLKWTDPTPCQFAAASGSGYTTGAVTISTSCEMPYNYSGYSSVDGPEHGNLTVSGGTLQIDSGAELVINSGYNISITNGTIAIGSGTNGNGKILLGDDMCGTDADGDGYISQSGWSTSCGALTSRASITKQYGFSDCNDGDANAHPGQASYFTSASAGSGTWDYNCDGSVTAQQGKGPTTAGVGQYYEITGYCYTDYASNQECFADESDCSAASINDWGYDQCSEQGYMEPAYQTYMYGNPDATEDIRLCVTSQSQTKCTPWLSQGGGWSDWAPVGGSSDNLNPSVTMQTTTLAAGSVFTGIMHGVQIDENNNMSDIGTSCTYDMETAPVGTSTNPAYSTTYCQTSISNTPDQMRVYAGGTGATVSSNPSAICPAVGGCH